MAQLVITIPDDKVTRVRTAFGHSGLNGAWVLATTADVQDWMLTQVKQRVRDYEAQSAVVAIETEIKNW